MRGYGNKTNIRVCITEKALIIPEVNFPLQNHSYSARVELNRKQYKYVSSTYTKNLELVWVNCYSLGLLALQYGDDTRKPE